MIRHKRLEPRFVTEVPQELDAGVLYVSMEYATVLHKCCCGCGEEVVTPLTPTDWKLCFDGSAVSLWPSVGNWNLPCKSHYVIRDNEVHESDTWTPQMIEKAILREKAAKAKFYAKDVGPLGDPVSERPDADLSTEPLPKRGFVVRFIRRLFR
jgi:hypothetical protein